MVIKLDFVKMITGGKITKSRNHRGYSSPRWLRKLDIDQSRDDEEFPTVGFYQ